MLCTCTFIIHIMDVDIDIETSPPPSYDVSERERNMISQSNANEELNEEQKVILSQVMNGSNVIITGSAGTGKSFLIKHICSELDKRNKILRIVAPTGVAAVNVGGQTIHRFLGIRPEVKTIPDYIKLCMKRSKVPWANLDVIIIDEISMIHPTLFLLFDNIARLHKKKNQPFGGLQLILIGDFYQLCPIKQKDDNPGDPEYIFETELWKELNLHVTVLKQVMRQNETDFVEALNDLRLGLYSSRVIGLVQKCTMHKRKAGIHYVRLFALNSQKDYENDTQLAKLTSETKIYNAVDIGNDVYLRDCRAAKKITLKLGCPVMLLWNMPLHGLYNGSIGILKKFDKVGLPIVEFNNGVTIPVPQQTWEIREKNKHGMRILASRKQIPLAVAWALSVHKSQSLTLDHLVVDCTGIFTTGQLYVALSRAATLGGLIIKNFNPDLIMIDTKVSQFYNSLEI